LFWVTKDTEEDSVVWGRTTRGEIVELFWGGGVGGGGFSLGGGAGEGVGGGVGGLRTG